MDSELLTPLPLSLSPSLPPRLPLNKKSRGRALAADSHQRAGACDLTIYVKESLIVFGNVLFIGWGLDAARLLFLICRQNKFVRQHDTE